MQVLILAAGYATRLYPLTKNQPKPLLEVAGKPMLEHVMDNMATIDGITDVFIVTNNKFATHFSEWSEKYSNPSGFHFKTINDGTMSDDDKLGAIGDIDFVAQREELKDLIVVAGDNLFSESLEEFGTFCKEKDAPVLAVYDVGDLEAIKKYNSITIDEDGKITFFEEKPANPTSTLTGIALYYYPERVVKMLDEYKAEGNNMDQPGRLIQWLYTRTPVYTWKVPGLWYDIGSKETLEDANQIFAEFKS